VASISRESAAASLAEMRARRRGGEERERERETDRESTEGLQLLTRHNALSLSRLQCRLARICNQRAVPGTGVGADVGADVGARAQAIFVPLAYPRQDGRR